MIVVSAACERRGERRTIHAIGESSDRTRARLSELSASDVEEHVLSGCLRAYAGISGDSDDITA